MSTTMVSGKAGGCGCKGGGSGKPGCGCKGNGLPVACDNCADTFAYQRPNFFNGQLLTEDDLQTLIQYVVDKNRLHSRYLWGDGVVCGLDASVDPCNPAFINVSPGYALDCCGNDLVLSCPVPLDIAAMIRDLRQRLGVDCGPECPPPADPAKPSTIVDPLRSVVTPGTAMDGMIKQPTTPAPAKTPTYRFSLYLRYCQAKTEPVSPYSTGNCADASCQATRVREGVRFELACYEPECPPPDLFSRYCDCLGLKDSTGRWQYINSLNELAEDTSKRMIHLEKGGLDFQAKELHSAIQAAKPYLDKASTRQWKDKITAGITATTNLLTQYARFFALDSAGRDQEGKRSAALLKSAVDALVSLNNSLDKAPTDLPPIETAQIKALKEQTGLWAAYGSSNLPEAEPTRLMAAGILPSDVLWSPVSRILDDQRSDLLKALELTPPSQSAQLAARIRTTPLSDYRMTTLSPAQPRLATIKAISQAAEAATLLRSTRLKLVLECLCRNLNPPCPECDDPRVLVACFGWEDCKVTDLCILVRKFVLTPSAMRYWIPWIGTIGDTFQRLCCGTGECDPQHDKGESVNLSTLVGRSIAGLWAGFMLRNCRLEMTKRFPTTGEFLGNQYLVADQIRPDSLEAALQSRMYAPLTVATPEDTVHAIQLALERPEVLELLRTKLDLKGVNP